MSVATRRTKREYRYVTPPQSIGAHQVAVSLLAEGGGYAMVRRPGCYPFVIDSTIWASSDVVERELA